MEIIAAVLGLFSFDNQDFFNTTNTQMKDGYEWHYVGKQVPDGNLPSLLNHKLVENILFGS